MIKSLELPAIHLMSHFAISVSHHHSKMGCSNKWSWIQKYTFSDWEMNGAQRWNRTTDTLLFRQMLYHWATWARKKISKRMIRNDQTHDIEYRALRYLSIVKNIINHIKLEIKLMPYVYYANSGNRRGPSYAKAPAGWHAAIGRRVRRRFIEGGGLICSFLYLKKR